MAHPGQAPDPDNIRNRDDIDEVLSQANPNPDRVGCPPRETLASLARRSEPLGDPAYEHLLKCSPCYREFRALQGAFARQAPSPIRSWSRVWVPAAAVLVLVVGLVAVWLTRGRGVPSSTSADAPVSAKLDLRRFSALRSTEPGETPAAVTLPRRVVDLTLLLPVGSEPGPYDVQLLDTELTSRASAHTAAEVRDFVTTLSLTLDLRSLPPGTYQLAVRRQGDDWRMFPAVISR
jgi:hypothetical protein